jgi:hypothetical protein
MAAGLRAVCLVALCAGFLHGCKSAPEEKAPSPAATPAPAPAPEPVAAAPAAQPPAAVAVVPPRPAPERKAPAKKRAPKPKPAPQVVQPAPAPPPPPQPSPEEERKRRLDAYVAAIGRSTASFNPPSPVQVGQRVAVSLSLTPPPETAALAEELRKSLDGGAAWTPRVRARLAGADFAIAPAEGRDSDGIRDLAAKAPAEWRWTVVPSAPGTKKLVATLTFSLPAQLGGDRDLPPLQRDVVVDATLSWQVERLWTDYWLWLVLAVVAVSVIALWARSRA